MASIFSRFSESKQNPDTKQKKTASTSIKYNKALDELVLEPKAPVVTTSGTASYTQILENALSLVSTFNDAIPKEIQKQICQQSLSQQSEGNLDKIIVEASQRKAQLLQEIKKETEQSETSVADINAEIDRLWNMRDQLQEESKQKQWGLTQRSEQFDQLISLLVDTDSPANAPSPDVSEVSPVEPEPELVVVSSASLQTTSQSTEQSVSPPRNPRRLSTLMTATN
jgi:septal ring factor EnvC (AmiA/AmiB activator)